MTPSYRAFVFPLSVFFIVTLNYLVGSTVFPLFDLDEGAYAEVSREMVASGNYFVTVLNNTPFYDKPALMYWLQSLSIKIFGISEFAYRFPSVIALTLWLMLIYSFIKKNLNITTAKYTTIIALTTAGVTVLFKSAIPDAFLNLFITATLFRVYQYFIDSKSIHIFYAYCFLALGVLTKGPIAVIIPFFTVLMFLLYIKQLKKILPLILYWKGWVAFLFICIPWYLIQYIQFGESFIQGFFGKHNIGRFMNAMEGHSGGIFFYVGSLLMLSLPFTSVLIKSFTQFKITIKQDLLIFLWLWFLFVFIFFTISATKLPHYLMYGLTPIWILLGYHLKDIKNQFWGLIPALLIISIIAVSPNLVEFIAQKFNNPYTQQTYQNISDDLPTQFYLVLTGSAIAFIVIYLLKNISLQNKVLASAFISSLSISFALLPMLGNFQQGVIKEAGLLTKKQNLDVIVWDLNMPSFNVYAQRTSEVRKPKVGEITLTKSKNLQSFSNVKYIINRRGVSLAKIVKK